MMRLPGVTISASAPFPALFGLSLMRSFLPSFSLATPHKAPCSKEPKRQKEPSGRASSQPSYQSSSGNKVKANTTLIKPSTRIITSVKSEICSVILNRKAPTIKPTPKFLIVSAKNFLRIDPILTKEARQ